MTIPPERLRVLVVDDERPARQRVIDRLGRDPDVGAISERDNGAAAIDAIRQDRPDLVFLDVQMPGLDGIAVIEALGPEAMPLTVFVTAYDQHAVKAFEANALDYLLKPFSDGRFDAAMVRAKARLADQSLVAVAARALALGAGAAAARRSDRLLVRSGGTTRFIKMADVDWIEAAGVYVNLHVGSKAVLHRATLTELTERLDPAQFVRIHRSAIVNIDSILQLEAVSHGEFDVVMKSGGRIRVSRTYRPQLEQRLGQPLV